MAACKTSQGLRTPKYGAVRMLTRRKSCGDGRGLGGVRACVLEL
jgi:hypothetical protein